MPDLDFKKTYKDLYAPSVKQFAIVNVPAFRFLMIDGQGDPNTSKEYQAALEALYNVSYTLKFTLKKEGGPTYKVPPLEGLWWAEDLSNFVDLPKSAWIWTMMIAQPDFIKASQVKSTIAELVKKKANPALQNLRLEKFAEGKAAQIMHIGPYSAEGPTIAKMHIFINEQGYKPRGKHHEIYLGDPRRTAPAKLRTVLRQPVG